MLVCIKLSKSVIFTTGICHYKNSCYNVIMTTIKEIAKISGFSPSTVSIVLSGKSNERRISEKTKLKILDAARQLDYRVNVSARRLRANHGSNMMISVFMTMDQRVYMMTRLLLSLQKAAAELGHSFEIVVHYYKSGSLRSFAESIELTHCAIICNASEEDQRFLEEAQFFVPIVLYNRTSKKYCAVTTNFPHVGEMAADIFARRGHKNAVLLDTITYFMGLRQCTAKFTETAKKHGLAVTHIHKDHNMAGGYQGGIAIGEMHPLPDCVFSMSDTMSIGVLRAFNRQGIKIPEQIELISLGNDNPELGEYASVPMSAIHIPVEVMAKECIRLLFLQLDGSIDRPYTSEVPVVYKCRETCGE